MADQNENKIEPIEREPSTLQKALRIGKIAAIAIVGVASALLGLQADEVIRLSPQIHDALVAVLGVGAALGIASKGAEKPSAPAK